MVYQLMKKTMSEPAMKLLMVASEAAPFAKTGGLADVVGSLPPALQALGHDVRLVMPWYRSVRKVTGNLRPSRLKVSIPMGGRVYLASFRTTEIKGVAVYFIDLPEFYDRAELYGEHGEDYPDNAERFGFLSRAALELARQLDFAPDVIHAHDWQAGLVPVYLHQHLWRDPFFAGTGSLFTIHNLGYQGIFPVAAHRILDLDGSLVSADALEYHGQISLLKGGIRFADRVNTVSPSYCREIQTAECGMGMDGLLRSRGSHLSGLLNGLDGTLWSPATDQALPRPYSEHELSGKTLCKKSLQEEFGLPVSESTPIAAMITRLDAQKGLDLILEGWDQILATGLQLVVLGTGSPDLEYRLGEAATYYPDQVRILLKFDDALARRIYAGSDLFLMPSRYEPCGLGQLIALRYGSIPLVHATGGLADTIIDVQSSENANGYLFEHYHYANLVSCLERALADYRDADNWRKLVLRGMSQDLSWDQAAARYVELYRHCTRPQPIQAAAAAKG